MKRIHPLIVVTWLVGIAFSPGALAAQVDARLSSQKAYVGVPVQLYVTIVNAADHEPPVLPEVNGLDFALAGTPSVQSQMTIINGHTTRNETLTYAIRVTPREPGRYTIPALTVTADGKAFATPTFTLVAIPSETGDLLFTEIQGVDESIYVGQPLPLTLRVGIRPFADEAHGIELNEAQMWSRISQDHSDWGIFTDTLRTMGQQGQRPGGVIETRVNDKGESLTYFVYEITASAYPNNAGTADIGRVHIVAAYPTGLETTRDFFGRDGLRLAGVRPITASADPPDVAIRPIPTLDRPADFRGAVGRYTIETRAEPGEVDAGDPITLAIRVRGDGPTHLLPAPPLADLAELTDRFLVPDEPLAGVVQDDAKIFSTTLRPRSADVNAIPAIPYSYFDPNSERFVTTASNPIAVTVREGQRLDLSRIVTADGLGEVPDAAPAKDDAGVPSVFFANMPIEAAALNPTQPRSLSWFIAIALALPPLLFVGLVLLRRALGWDWRDTDRQRAAEQIAKAKTIDELIEAVRAYAVQRLALPRGATGHEIVTHLSVEHRDAGAVQRWFAAGDAARFAPGLNSDIESMRTEADRCVEELEASR